MFLFETDINQVLLCFLQVNISAASWDTNAWGYWKLEFVVECAMVVLEEPAPEFAPPNVSTFGSVGVAHWESTRERDRLEVSRKVGVNVDSEFWDWHNWWLGDGDRDGSMWNVYNVCERPSSCGCKKPCADAAPCCRKCISLQSSVTSFRPVVCLVSASFLSSRLCYFEGHFEGHQTI